MDLSLFLRGSLLGFCIAAPVGPIGILCIRRTLSVSRASGLASGLGAATADALYGVVAAFGITAVSEALLNGRVWLAWTGGLFLCWLGWKSLAARAPKIASLENLETGARSSLWSAWGSTFLLTITNPMTILSFAAVFAGMGLGSMEHGPASAVALVSGVFLGSAAWWLALSGAVSMIRSRFSPASLVWVNRLSGVILVAFGVAALLLGGASGGANPADAIGQKR